MIKKKSETLNTRKLPQLDKEQEKKKPIDNIVKDYNFLWWLEIRQECPLWPLTQHRIGNSRQCKKIKKEIKWIQIRKNKMFSICRWYGYFIENTKEYTKKKKKTSKNMFNNFSTIIVYIKI